MCSGLHFAPNISLRRIILNPDKSAASCRARHWSTSCILLPCLRCGARLGWILTTLFGGTAVMPIAVPNPAPKKRRSLLPVLTGVFIASYALMTMLIVEQGGVIQQQHNLIQILQTDSAELWAMKGKAVVDKANRESAKKYSNTPGTRNQGSSTQTPNGTPSSQAPASKQSQIRSGREGKPHIQLPPVPASDLGDQRRVLITL